MNNNSQGEMSRNQRYVITGATSMIGIALIEKCIQHGVSVLAIVRKNTTRINRLPKSDFITICECDLEDLENVQCPAEQYDVFYHLAWQYTSKEQRDNPILQERNIQYALAAVELAKRLGCKKFVGAGSQAEYGPTEGMIAPDTRVAPQIAYGIAKYAAGKLTQKLCQNYGMHHIWVRIFSVYGKYDNDGTMLNYAIEQFLSQKTAHFSAATQMWDYLHADDAGEYLYRIGERVEGNHFFCLASGQSKPLREYIMDIVSAFHNDVRYTFEAADPAQMAYGIQADIASIVSATEYVPQTSFLTGIQEMIAYHETAKG